MDLSFLMPSRRMRDYCTQIKELAHLGGSKDKGQGQNMKNNVKISVISHMC